MKLISTVFVVVLLMGESLCQTGDSCDEATLHANAEMCNAQRSVLSEASAEAVETRNHTILCKAFAEYMRCMEPKIGHCNSSTTGFTVIRSTYSAPPYNCAVIPVPGPTPEETGPTPGEQPTPPRAEPPGDRGQETEETSDTPPSGAGSRPSLPALLPVLCLALTAVLTRATALAAASLM